MSHLINIKRIKMISDALRGLGYSIVFVGGAIVS
jgi:hypothetical protein